jgi:S1-C subfamily serine protease
VRTVAAASKNRASGQDERIGSAAD